MSKKYKIIKMVKATTGKCAKVEIYNLDKIINNEISFCRTDQIGIEDSKDISQSLCSLSEKEFIKIFSAKDITKMQENGRLSYDFEKQSYKYPIFGAKIYKKYGIRIG